MQASVYTRERKHIGSTRSRVTSLALEDSRCLRHLTIAIRNKHSKQINKQYTKQYLMTEQIELIDATRRYENVSTRITEIGATVKKL
jgi:peptidase E